MKGLESLVTPNESQKETTVNTADTKAVYIPSDIHAKAKAAAAETGIPLYMFVANALEKALQ